MTKINLIEYEAFRNNLSSPDANRLGQLFCTQFGLTDEQLESGRLTFAAANQRILNKFVKYPNAADSKRAMGYTSSDDIAR